MGIFFGNKMECVGAGISGGGPPGAHKTGGRAQGGGRGLHSRGLVLAPPAVISVPKILYSRKNHTKLARHLEHFYFWDIFYCMDNSESRQIILFFSLFILNNRK